MNIQMTRRNLLRAMAAAPAFGLLRPLSAAPVGRPMVAVLDFDATKGTGKAREVFGANVDLGRNMADLTLTQLTRNSVFQMIDRTLTRKALDEQNFSNSNRADLTVCARIGKLLSAGAFLTGSVEQFSVEELITAYDTGVSRDVVDMIPGGWGSVLGKLARQVERRSEHAIVRINYRLVSVETLTVLAAGEGRGEESRAKHGAKGKKGSSLSETVAAAAMHRAIVNIANQLETSMAALSALAPAPPARVALTGAILSVAGNRVVINLGSKDGLRAGQSLTVKRKGPPVRNGEGQAVYQSNEEVGTLVVADVQERGAAGSVSGRLEVKVNDIVEFDPAQ